METKEKILQVSRALFTSNGYEGTAMTMIADEVGIKKPSLYAHYRSKAEIFEAVLQKESMDYVSFLKESLNRQETSVKDLLYQLLTEHALDKEDEIRNEFYYRFIKYRPVGLESVILDIFTEMEEETVKIFYQIIDRGKANGEIDPDLSNAQIYETYFLLIDGLSTMSDVYKYKYESQGALDVWELFYRGIRK